LSTRDERLAQSEPSIQFHGDPIKLFSQESFHKSHENLLPTDRAWVRAGALWQAEQDQVKFNAVVKILRNVYDQIHLLASDSEGVAGLHRNGDIAEWKELFPGGQYQEWLISLEDACAVLAESEQPRVMP
jgi:hypothetical protein